jgi:coenzyme F420-0:L-glutamate ligase/coenzyme F420-1:gamma-L-glutamate ligase
VLTIRPVTGIGDVRPGDDLAELIAAAAPWLADGDVLVVTSKIVSKSEGRLVDLPIEGVERAVAREAALAGETARPVATRGGTRIVATHHGFVLANAGIDASNVEPGRLVLLPKEPDASARSLRAALHARLGVRVAVIISDTMGRPWRLGLTDVAIGVAGIGPLRDHRGERDRYGNELTITQMAVVDELCAAAELVKGKVDGLPVAVVRGLPAPPDDGLPIGHDDGPGAAALVRPLDQDLFEVGSAEARADGLRAAATLPDLVRFAPAEIDQAALARALSTVDLLIVRLDAALRGGVAGLPESTKEVLVPREPGGDARSWARAGAAVQRLRTALAAEGLASVWLDTAPEAFGAPLGVVAVGVAA